MVTIVIERRFNGFQDIALGGYVGGVLARGHQGAEVTLRRPVRLGKEYQFVDLPDGSAALQDGDETLAVSRDASVDLEVPAPVELGESEAAAEGYVGLRRHLIPTCFTCGTQRQEGDGLRIFAGRVPGRDLVAAPWTPTPSLADPSGRVGPEFVWSALDCPTIWALIVLGERDTDERAVTSRLAVELLSPVSVGEPLIVTGWRLGEAGRARLAGGAIHSADGRLLAKAIHTLFTTDWGVPMGLSRWQ